MDEKKVVFSFDRDGTIDVNPLNTEHQVIPLEWVQYLAHETDHEVWAHGNQTLKEEAGIPGTAELMEAYKENWGDPITHVNERDHKDLETELSIDSEDPLPEPDIVTAAANWFKLGKRPSKQQYLRLLSTLLPDADEYVCVDNQYLTYVSGWDFYYPHEFVDQYTATISDELKSVDRSKLSTQASQVEFADENTRSDIRLLSSLGRHVPRSVRERLEIRPDKKVPIRFRK